MCKCIDGDPHQKGKYSTKSRACAPPTPTAEHATQCTQLSRRTQFSTCKQLPHCKQLLRCKVRKRYHLLALGWEIHKRCGQDLPIVVCSTCKRQHTVGSTRESSNVPPFSALSLSWQYGPNGYGPNMQHWRRRFFRRSTSAASAGSAH